MISLRVFPCPILSGSTAPLHGFERLRSPPLEHRSPDLDGWTLLIVPDGYEAGVFRHDSRQEGEALALYSHESGEAHISSNEANFSAHAINVIEHFLGSHL